MITKRAYFGKGIIEAAGRNLQEIPARKVGVGLIGGMLAANQVSKAIRAIQSNTRQKALIEDLILTDPMIKQADKREVLEYYAMIVSIAPAISLEKPIIRELLQTFIRFGRVDMQTLKTLAETQRNAEQGKPAGSFKDLADLSMIAGKALINM